MGYGGDLRLDDVASGCAALGLFEDAEYWYEAALRLLDGSEAPLHLVYSLAAQGARLSPISTSLEQAETMVVVEGPYDVPYLLTYGGLARTHLGDAAKAIEWLERGISLYQRDMAPEDPPDNIDYSLLSQHWGSDWGVVLAQRLAFAYRLTGNGPGMQQALRFLERESSQAMLPTNPEYLESFALTSVLLGDAESALQYLRTALELGWANYRGVVTGPAWAETLEKPEFQAVFAQARANNDRQRSIVETADDEHDFRAEFERFLSVNTESQ